MHRKEEAIAPVMASLLGLHVITPPDIDTDQFGTFTGETPRQGTMLDVAILKARRGMAVADLRLGLASEGSFGPHPSLPILPAGMELLVFVDDERSLVIHESLATPDTNFSHLVVSTGELTGTFLRRVGFPRHALVVRPNKSDVGLGLVKGLVDFHLVEKAIDEAAALSIDGKARVETDMRAHLNPTRMKSLGKLAKRLARRIATYCPACQSPGFGRTATRPGLRCEDCGAPTSLIAVEIFDCAVCCHREERPRSDKMHAAPGRFCPECNP